jgi:TPR repeat protein
MKGILIGFLAICSLCITVSVLFFVGTIGPKVNKIGETEIAEFMAGAKVKLTDSLQNALGYVFMPKNNDYKKAFNTSRILAARKDPQALFNLGYMYETGKFAFADRFKAMDYYQKAADLGYVPAQVNLANIYVNLRKYNEALKLYEAASNQNSALAQYNLALSYERGYGVSRDSKKAIELFEKAAEQGIIWADYALGMIYYEQREYANALKYFLKVQDIPPAAHRIGIIYINGYAGEKDEQKGIEYLTRAGEVGYVKSQMILAALYKNKKDYQKAFYWYLKAADNGNAEAQYNIGDFYKNGFGVQKDLNKANEYLRKAAMMGNARAKQALNNTDKNVAANATLQNTISNTVSANSAKPLKPKLKKAVSKSTENIMVEREKCLDVEKGKEYAYIGTQAYYEGNYSKALDYCLRAAKLGASGVFSLLSKLYLDGKGVGKNIEESNKWKCMKTRGAEDSLVEDQVVSRGCVVGIYVDKKCYQEQQK